MHDSGSNIILNDSNKRIMLENSVHSVIAKKR